MRGSRRPGGFWWRAGHEPDRRHVLRVRGVPAYRPGDARQPRPMPSSRIRAAGSSGGEIATAGRSPVEPICVAGLDRAPSRHPRTGDRRARRTAVRRPAARRVHAAENRAHAAPQRRAADKLTGLPNRRALIHDLDRPSPRRPAGDARVLRPRRLRVQRRFGHPPVTRCCAARPAARQRRRARLSARGRRVLPVIQLALRRRVAGDPGAVWRSASAATGSRSAPPTAWW